jgi:thiol-disulfide isomerase/thioredoxin
MGKPSPRPLLDSRFDLVMKTLSNRLRRTALSLVALTLTGLLPAHASLTTGGPAPDLSGQHADKVISLKGLKGQVIYVDFWASWCAPCAEALPALDALYREFKPAGFMALGVNKDMRPKDAERFLTRVPISFPTLYDSDDRWAKAFAIPAMPTGILIDRQGRIRHVHAGYTKATAAVLREQIKTLLKEPA